MFACLWCKHAELSSCLWTAHLASKHFVLWLRNGVMNNLFCSFFDQWAIANNVTSVTRKIIIITNLILLVGRFRFLGGKRKQTGTLRTLKIELPILRAGYDCGPSISALRFPPFYRRNIMTSGNEKDVGLVTEVKKATQTLYKTHVTLCCWRLRYGKKIGVKVEATLLLL